MFFVFCRRIKFDFFESNLFFFRKVCSFSIFNLCNSSQISVCFDFENTTLTCFIVNMNFS